MMSFSTKEPQCEGKFYLSVYFSCILDNIKLECLSEPRLEFQEILEESEEIQKVDEKLKEILKVRGKKVIFS